MRSNIILVALMLFGGSGCNTVALVDNVDLYLDFNPLDGPSDSLHSPYVQGSSMGIWVRNTDARTDPKLWSLESSDESVFSIVREHHATDEIFYVDAKAIKAGNATLIVRNENNEILHERPIEVRLPDRVDLLAHGLLLIDRSEEEARLSEARVRATGTGTYLARYYSRGELLSGNGALAVESTPDATVKVVRTYLFEDRDWLQITPTRTGTSAITFKVGGTEVGAFPVVGVPDSDIVQVRILGEDESKARKDEPLVALALSFDAQNRSIYGVEYKWKHNGANEAGLGDLYRYRYEPNRPAMITATFAGMSAAAEIHGNGYVDSSNRLGCSTAPGARAPAGLFVIFLLLGALQLLRMSRYMRQLLFAGSSASTDSHSLRASSLRPSE
jgi:hypothetical protein